MGIVSGAIVLGGNFPGVIVLGENCLGGNCPRWQLSCGNCSEGIVLFRNKNASINLGPSETVRVDYEKYLLKILPLLKFVRVSNGIHTNACSFYLK